jgi:hypothetical protein
MHIEDNDQFTEHLTSARPLEVLLRGHLWVEAELIAVLQDVLPFPNLIDLDRLNFPQKISFVAAHGFIRPEDIPAYMKLNSLRNKVAHNLTAEPGEEYANDLISSFGPHLKHLIDELSKESDLRWEEWIWRLRYAITALCINLGTERERLTEYRRQVLHANAKLRESAQHLLSVFGDQAKKTSE